MIHKTLHLLSLKAAAVKFQVKSFFLHSFSLPNSYIEEEGICVCELMYKFYKDLFQRQLSTYVRGQHWDYRHIF